MKRLNENRGREKRMKCENKKNENKNRLKREQILTLSSKISKFK